MGSLKLSSVHKVCSRLDGHVDRADGHMATLFLHNKQQNCFDPRGSVVLGEQLPEAWSLKQGPKQGSKPSPKPTLNARSH